MASPGFRKVACGKSLKVGEWAAGSVMQGWVNRVERQGRHKNSVQEQILSPVFGTLMKTTSVNHATTSTPCSVQRPSDKPEAAMEHGGLVLFF